MVRTEDGGVGCVDNMWVEKSPWPQYTLDMPLVSFITIPRLITHSNLDQWLQTVWLQWTCPHHCISPEVTQNVCYHSIGLWKEQFHNEFSQRSIMLEWKLALLDLVHEKAKSIERKICASFVEKQVTPSPSIVHAAELKRLNQVDSMWWIHHALLWWVY